MTTIRIGTLNIQNKVVRKNKNKKSISDYKRIEALRKYIIENNFNILGVQETLKKFINKIKIDLKEYEIYGKSRYGNSKIVNKIKILNNFNESNPIITNSKILRQKTFFLPWITLNPKIFIKSIKNLLFIPRIITKIEIKYENNTIVILNTHLDYRYEQIQKKQLNKILKIVNKISKRHKNIIIMGDFNMEINNNNFSNFINQLDSLGIRRVENNVKTNDNRYTNQTAIDHIFIPKTWEIEQFGVIEFDNMDLITDHKGIYVDAKIK